MAGFLCGALGAWYTPTSFASFEWSLKQVESVFRWLLETYTREGLYFYYISIFLLSSQSLPSIISIFRILGRPQFLLFPLTNLECWFEVSYKICNRDSLLLAGQCCWRILGPLTVSCMWISLIIIGCNYPSLWVFLLCKLVHISKAMVLLCLLVMAPERGCLLFPHIWHPSLKIPSSRKIP